MIICAGTSILGCLIVKLKQPGTVLIDMFLFVMNLNSLSRSFVNFVEHMTGQLFASMEGKLLLILTPLPMIEMFYLRLIMRVLFELSLY